MQAGRLRSGRAPDSYVSERLMIEQIKPHHIQCLIRSAMSYLTALHVGRKLQPFPTLIIIRRQMQKYQPDGLVLGAAVRPGDTSDAHADVYSGKSLHTPGHLLGAFRADRTLI